MTKMTNAQQFANNQMKEICVLRMKDMHKEFLEYQDCIIKDVLKKAEKEVAKKVIHSLDKIKKLLHYLVDKECELAIPNERNRSKNMGLSRAEFKEGVRKLKQGDEYIIEKIFLAHYNQCVKFLVYNNTCDDMDAGESFMEALYEIRTDLIKEKISYGNLHNYITVRAKMKLTKILKKKKKHDAIDGKDIQDEEHIQNDIEEKEIIMILTKAIERLCDRCQKIIRLKYYEELKFDEIAELMNIKSGTAKKAAFDCRTKLRKYLGEDFNNKFFRI